MPSSLVSSRRRRGFNGLSRPNSAKDDRTLRESIESLRESGEELEHINEKLRDVLGLPANRTRGFISGAIQAIVPRKFYGFLPEKVADFIAEEGDVLEQMEGAFRGNVDSTQISLRSLVQEGRKKHDQLQELADDITRAQEEGWDARQLQEYMADKAGVELYDEVAEMLDQEFGFLPDEEKERRKEELLIQLQNNLAIGGRLTETIDKVCIAGIRVFDRGVGGYYNFMNVYRPIAAIRDAARNLVNMDETMLMSRDALVETLGMSLVAIEHSIKAAELAEKYSITSTDMHKLLEECNDHLGEQLKVLDASKPKLLADSAGITN